MPRSRGRSGPAGPRRRPIPPSRAVARSPVAEAVDAHIRDLRAVMRTLPEDLRPVAAEAAAARFAGATDALFADLEAPGVGEQLRASFWEQLAAELGRRGDDHSAALLAAMCHLAQPELRPVLLRALQKRGPARERWVGRVGTARLTRTVISDDTTGDGANVLLGFDDGTAQYTLVHYIDFNLGGIAKDIFVGPPIDEVLQMYRDVADIVPREVSPELAFGTIAKALVRTMESEDPPISDEFEQFAALSTALVRDAGAIEVPEDQPVLDEADRRRLVEDFLASDFAAQLDVPRDLVADIVGAWVNYAAEETKTGPLRASAVLVELFMVDEVPFGMEVGPRYLDAVPPVLRAWLRYLATRTAVSAEGLQEALAAVDRWAPEMRSSVFYEDGDFNLANALAAGAARMASSTLGPDYAEPAAELGRRLPIEAANLMTTGLPRLWPAAVVWLIAEDAGLVGRSAQWGIEELAYALDSTPKTMRMKARMIREALELDPD